MAKPTSVQISADTHRELMTEILKSQLDTGKRVTFDQMITATLIVARQYPALLTATLEGKE